MKRLQRVNHIADHFPACYAGLGYPTPSASPGQASFDTQSLKPIEEEKRVLTMTGKI
jgi:hypothetical protein